MPGQCSCMHSQRAARSFVRGLEIRLYTAREVENLSIVWNVLFGNKKTAQIITIFRSPCTYYIYCIVAGYPQRRNFQLLHAGPNKWITTMVQYNINQQRTVLTVPYIHTAQWRCESIRTELHLGHAYSFITRRILNIVTRVQRGIFSSSWPYTKSTSMQNRHIWLTLFISFLYPIHNFG
jgi:hypothetical protein